MAARGKPFLQVGLVRVEFASVWATTSFVAPPLGASIRSEPACHRLAAQPHGTRDGTLVHSGGVEPMCLIEACLALDLPFRLFRGYCGGDHARLVTRLSGNLRLYDTSNCFLTGSQLTTCAYGVK